MRFGGVSMTMVGAATLLLALGAPEAGAQRGRLGVLRPAPQPQMGLRAARPRWAAIAPHFFNSCFIVPPFGFFPYFGGGMPFVNIQIFTGGQPSPDPTSHLVPDPSTQPVPWPGSHPLPGSQPVPGPHPVPGAVATNPHAVPAFATPVYSTPVYTAPVYGAATPVATPRVSSGMVVGDVIIDPTFGLWGSSFLFGGVACVPYRSFGRTIIVR